MRTFDRIVELLGGTLWVYAACAFAYALYQHWFGRGFDFTPAATALAALVFVAPTLVAARRKHRNRMAICALNVLLGATGVGWIAALIWSLTANIEARHAGVSQAH